MSNDIEIEAKYLVNSDLVNSNLNELKEQVLRFFHENAFTAENDTTHGISYFLTDTYYDTADQQVLKSGMSLRIRQKGGKQYITFKKSLTPGAAQSSQWERFERERETAEFEIDSEGNKDFIEQCFFDVAEDRRFSVADLKKTVTIRNKRQQYIFINATAAYEVAFDDVTYFDEETQKEFSERQLEIEKCTDETPVEHMRVLINKLEARLGDSIEPCWESKFERACHSLNLHTLYK
ncbi:MAG: CYTH domain-containing protein [Peptococcaceae bacterium]|nr:CYTH domain-containing protein [Peptococcaceae bacterium]